MSIRTTILTKARNVDDQRESWNRFVRDHRDEILAKSTEHVISKDLMAIVRYNLDRYLREISIPSEYGWIIRLINDIPGDNDFMNITSLFIPDTEHIEDLFALYATTTMED